MAQQLEVHRRDVHPPAGQELRAPDGTGHGRSPRPGQLRERWPSRAFAVLERETVDTDHQGAAQTAGRRWDAVAMRPLCRRSAVGKRQLDSRDASARADGRPVGRVLEALEARLLAGGAWHDHDLVFSAGLGTAIEAGNLTRSWTRARRPPARRTRARTTSATCTPPYCWRRGFIRRVVSERLGHGSVAFTLNT